MLMPEDRGYYYVPSRCMYVKWVTMENYFLGNKSVN